MTEDGVDKRSSLTKPRRAYLLGVLALLVLLLGYTLFRHRSTGLEADGFDLPAPHTLANPKTLWATWYWTPTYKTTAPGIPLLDTQERPLGPKLDRVSYCSAAVEGAVRVNGQVYTFADTGHTKLTDCTPYWPTMGQAPYVRFRKSPTPFGEGVDGYDLVPYRSIAVDTDVIPTGTVLYIPSARGNLLSLPDGRHVRHDGYFFAADDGYGIDGNHIDVFIGISNICPFPWVVSRPTGPFMAYVVTDPAVLKRLRQEHLPI